MNPRLAAALLVALTLAAWGAVPWGAFHFDDYQNLVLDESMGKSTALRARLVEGVRPLLRLSYALDLRLWGLTPKGFLATNLALHVATVIGVWTLARTRIGSEVGALLAGAVFALQPAGAETVAYVSGRSTGLMAALLVWALVCHEIARNRQGPRRAAWRAASLGLFAAACLAKEVALIFPALLALWEWTRRDVAKPPFSFPLPLAGEGQGEGRRESPTRRDVAKPPFGFPLPPAGEGQGEAHGESSSTPDRQDLHTRRVLFAAALAASIVLALLLAIPRYRDLAAFSLALRSPLASLAVNARAVPLMLSLWVRPWALSVDHGFNPDGTPAAIAGGVALIAAFAATAIALRRRAPIVTLAIGWALLSLAPTNSLIAKLDPVTEKPLYLAWLGPALALGAAFAAASAAAPVRTAVAVIGATAWLAFGGCETAARVRVWSDARTLWRDAVAKAPEKSRCWNNLGMAYFAHDQDRAALNAFERAITLDPGNRFARRNRALVGFLAADDDGIRTPRHAN